MLLVEYQPKWQEDFNNIKEVLAGTLSSYYPTIEHIGSTSVEGLAAKPIIDIDIVYDEITNLSNIIRELQLIGYTHVGNQGIAGREVFKRKMTHQNHPVLDTIPHHLYACHVNSQELKCHLTFRDHLRKNEEIRLKYEQLKHDIAEQANQDRKKYALLKQDQAKGFIDSVLRDASSSLEAAKK